jgi:hypothetical protein
LIDTWGLKVDGEVGWEREDTVEDVNGVELRSARLRKSRR